MYSVVCRRAGLHPWTISQLINGVMRLTPRIALKLEPVLGIDARDLLMLQVDEDLAKLGRLHVN